MKHIYVSKLNCALILLLLIQSLSKSANAQTTYSVNSSKNWSPALPNPCNSCTIDIASGATLTVNGSITCQNCTFAGGTVSIASQTLNLTYTGGQTVVFNGTNLAASGTGSVVANGPISVSNATFTFGNTSSLTTDNNVTLTSSTINLNDNATMTSNGNVLNTVNLISDSRIVVGNGSLTSSAAYSLTGPTMVVYDNSSVAVANQNNVFSNAGAYLYLANTSASIFTAKVYTTSTLNLNCGSGYAHSCSSPSLYGPATVANGTTSAVTLPIILDGFAGVLNSDHTVTLNWNTQMEIDFSHFAIERSADGATWETIATVRAKGNSEVQTDYSFTDEQPLNGTNDYRLVLVNDDDSYTYSQVVVMESETIAKVSFFPNPAQDYVNVSLGATKGGQVTILLTSISGRLMQEKTAATGSGVVVTFPIQNMAAGMYILTVVNGDGTRESSPVLITRS